MEDYIPYDLTDDDITEELPPKDIYKPVPVEGATFPDIEFLKNIGLNLS